MKTATELLSGTRLLLALRLPLVSSYNICEKKPYESAWAEEEKIIEAISMSHMCTL